ncbi:helix-hairpin-helix domain-containing protein [Aestuariirhabdus sp. Z084]|uniref:ComEA family DNA-binding protein n=1 Tax=Aestuariirhabdus haliotis TaxID=2918751 RepID=UPI00201B3F58|nr:ComEA family DNA-binding protein [Aestuariirhabdus haliotis]MCL6417287.1 helix-hairpin-helix domain-containing protein [Aestuariirhabdus haliotis]MCL6421232.1 helix-hairpin-helix domain-containing protein [Aestuariirhabdus haliotis]
MSPLKQNLKAQLSKGSVSHWMLLVALLFAPLSWADSSPATDVSAHDKAAMKQKVLLAAEMNNAAAEPQTTVNVNTANAEEISQELKGIGMAKAEAIVAYREKHGAFVALEELTAVKGIGDKTLAKNAEKIRLE